MRTRRYRKRGGDFLTDMKEGVSSATSSLSNGMSSVGSSVNEGASGVNDIGAKMTEGMSGIGNFFSGLGSKAKGMVDPGSSSVINNAPTQPTSGGKRRKSKRKRTKRRAR